MTNKQDTKAINKQIILALLEAAKEAAQAENWDTVVELSEQIRNEALKMKSKLLYSGSQMVNQDGIDEAYEAMVADVRPTFGLTKKE